MPQTGWSQEGDAGYPWWQLQKTRGGVPYLWSYHSRVLLAKKNEWCQGLCEEVPTILKVCSFLKYTERGPQHIMEPLVLHVMALNIVGPLPRAQPQFEFLLAIVDHFTKWTKVVSLQSCRIPGGQILMAELRMSLWFPTEHFIRWWNELRQQRGSCLLCQVQNHLSVLYTALSISNDLVEISNHTILDILCNNLNKVKGKWVEKLLGMV